MNSVPFLHQLLELLAKSALILLAAAALAAALSRGSAAQRHTLWLAVFAALLLLPLTKLAAPRWHLPGSPGTGPATVRALPALTLTPLDADPPTAAAPVANSRSWSWPNPQHLLVGAWLLGAAGILGYRWLGSLQIAVLRRRSRASASVRMAVLAQQAAGEMNLREPCEIRLAPAVSVPCTAGVRRPAVLLPVTAGNRDDARLLTTLRHEFAHIRRHDYLARWGALLACALYWPNPLVWLAARRLHTGQEQACDDLVLRAGTPPADYAALLLETARAFTQPGESLRAALAMARPSTLEGRVLAIVDDTRDRRPAGRAFSLAGVFGVAAIIGASALAQVAPKQIVDPLAETIVSVEVRSLPPRTPASSTTPLAAPIVRAIEVPDGDAFLMNQETLRANLRTRVGQPYSEQAIAEDLRYLQETNRMASARIFGVPVADGVKVLITTRTPSALDRTRTPLADATAASVFITTAAEAPLDIDGRTVRLKTDEAITDGERAWDFKRTTVKFGQTTVTAQSIRYDPARRRAEFAGNVEIQQQTKTTRSKKLTVQFGEGGHLTLDGPPQSSTEYYGLISDGIVSVNSEGQRTPGKPGLYSIQQAPAAAATAPEPDFTPQAVASPVEDAAKVLARVNGQIINAKDVQANLPRGSKDDPAAQKATLENLVDRLLILEEFERRGFTIPDAILDDRVAVIVREEFSGDQARFEQTLKAQGYDLASFRKMQRDTIGIQEMRRQAAKDVPTTERPRAIEEWLQGLRGKARIDLSR